MVPCDGLYADIDSLKEDLDSLKQDLVKGRMPKEWYDLNFSGVYWSKEDLHNTHQDMFPSSANEIDDEVNLFTAIYHEYKMKYLKHLNFNPNAENYSKFILTNFHF